MEERKSFLHLLTVAIFVCILLTFAVFFVTDALVGEETQLTDTCLDGSVVEGSSPIDALHRAVYQNKDLLALIREYAYRLFGIVKSDNVFAGKNGFLFAVRDGQADYNYVRDYLGKERFSAEESAKIARNLIAERDAYAANGIEYLLVVVPNAQTVYAENMPSFLGKISEHTRLSALTDELARAGFTELLDLTDFLLANKSQGLLYSNTENSLSTLGLYYSYLGIYDYFAESSMQHISPIKPSELSFYQHFTQGRQLAEEAGLSNVVQNQGVSLSATTSLHYRFVYENEGNGATTIMIKNQQERSPYLQLCFSRAWDRLQSQPFFSNTFTYVTYVDTPSQDPVGGRTPDIAIRLIYENELSQLLY